MHWVENRTVNQAGLLVYELRASAALLLLIFKDKLSCPDSDRVPFGYKPRGLRDIYTMKSLILAQDER